MRINLDMLKKREREELLVRACLDAGQSFVVDNTNPSGIDRARYIAKAKAAGFTIEGYFFDSRLDDALQRNAKRKGQERIPDQGLLHVLSHLERPTREEGFDNLFVVRMNNHGGFRVNTMRNKTIK